MHTSANPDSIEALFAIPRLLMGLIAVFDTFLVYRIVQRKYDTKIAIFASAFFAVMPMTWIMRRILLDSILLPFLLLAILFAMYSKNNSKFVPISGICMGLAIFTKIPVFTMIPLAIYLIYSGTKNKKMIGLWLIPVLLLPLIWPAQSLLSGNFNHWLHDVVWQTQRNRIGLFEVTEAFLAIDPIMFVLGLSGIVLCVIRRDKFVLLWFGPYVAFLGVIGFVQYFHWMMLLPVFAVGMAHFTDQISKNIKKPRMMLTPFFGIVLFGVICTTVLVSTNMTSSQFEAIAFTANLAKENQQNPILANPVYSWALYNVFDLKNTIKDYDDALHAKIPQKMIMISDPHLRRDFDHYSRLTQVDALTIPLTEYKDPKEQYNLQSYPYSSLNYNHDAGVIEIKMTKND